MNLIRRARKRARDRGASESGAALVEFAFIMPLLVLMLFGIVEFSWLLATNLDVNQGAREGARITAVNIPDNNVDLTAEICQRMDLVGANNLTSITWVSDPAPPVAGGGVTVTVSTPVSTLTGLLDSFFSSLLTLESTVEIRIEQPPDWIDGTWFCP